MPGALPNDPKAEEQVGKGVSSDGIAESTAPTDEALVNDGAENAGEPLMMGQTEDDGGGHEWSPTDAAEGDRLEGGVSQVAIEEGAVEYFLNQGHDESGPEESDDDEGPSQRALIAKDGVGVPWGAVVEGTQFGVERVQTNPKGGHENTGGDGLSGESPAHLGDEGPDHPNQTRPDTSFEGVDPKPRGLAEPSLNEGESDEDRERKHACLERGERQGHLRFMIYDF
jgi:hypothetical protein